MKTMTDIMKRLLDPQFRSCEIEFRNSDALAFLSAILEVQAQPQLAKEHQDLIARHQRVVFLGNDPRNKVIPRNGDVLIGQLCGRAAIIPREVFQPEPQGEEGEA